MKKGKRKDLEERLEKLESDLMKSPWPAGVMEKHIRKEISEIIQQLDKQS